MGHIFCIKICSSAEWILCCCQIYDRPGNLCSDQFTNTSLPFEKLDLDAFFPKSRVLIHFPGDLPIVGILQYKITKACTPLPALFHMITAQIYIKAKWEMKHNQLVTATKMINEKRITHTIHFFFSFFFFCWNSMINETRITHTIQICT